jgi:hypothetical protein
MRRCPRETKFLAGLSDALLMVPDRATVAPDPTLIFVFQEWHLAFLGLADAVRTKSVCVFMASALDYHLFGLVRWRLKSAAGDF